MKVGCGFVPFGKVLTCFSLLVQGFLLIIVHRFREHFSRRDVSQAGAGRGSPSCVLVTRARTSAPVPCSCPLLLSREAPSEGLSGKEKGRLGHSQNGVRAVGLGSLRRTKHYLLG